MANRELSWARATLWGVAAMAGSGAVGILLRLLGFLNLADARRMSDGDIVALVVFILAIIPTVVLPILALRRLWAIILALCLLPAVPFALAALTTLQPFGPIRALTLAEARPPSGLESGIRIIDAAPRADLARIVTFGVTSPAGRRGAQTTTTYRYHVAPVVEAGWRPGLPVAAWAVLDHTDDDPRWDAAAGALFRPIDRSLAERAVSRFLADQAAPGRAAPFEAAPVIGLWVAESGAARRAQVTAWALVLAGASLAWTLLAWLARLSHRIVP